MWFWLPAWGSQLSTTLLANFRLHRRFSCATIAPVPLLLTRATPAFIVQAAQKRVRQILRDSGGCKFSCAAFGLALILVLLIVLLFKLL